MTGVVTGVVAGVETGVMTGDVPHDRDLVVGVLGRVMALVGTMYVQLGASVGTGWVDTDPFLRSFLLNPPALLFFALLFSNFFIRVFRTVERIEWL